MKTRIANSYAKLLVLSLITLMTSCKETMKPEDIYYYKNGKAPMAAYLHLIK